MENNSNQKQDCPLVFVRCLTFNHEAYIEDALNGFVIQQTNFPFIVTIVNDASPDNTKNVIEKFITNICESSNIIHEQTSYADIIKATPKENPNCLLFILNLYENHFLKKSHRPYYQEYVDKAKYWAECEGDDYWTDPLKLQKQVDILEANVELSVCVSQVQTVSVAKEKLNWLIPARGIIDNGVFTMNDFCRLEWGGMQWVFHYNSLMCRRDYAIKWVENKIMKMFPYGDMPLILFCLLNGNGYFLSDVMSCYRVDSGGYNSSMNKNPSKNIQQEKQLVLALRAFDLYTYNKYHKYVQQRIRLCEYREYTLGDKNHWRVILPQYWCCLPGETARQKILNAMDFVMPNFRKWLKNAKNTLVHL